MCGISGKLYFHRDGVVDPDLISRMNGAMAHRGPDGEGVYVYGPVGLGHRRLAITVKKLVGYYNGGETLSMQKVVSRLYLTLGRYWGNDSAHVSSLIKLISLEELDR